MQDLIAKIEAFVTERNWERYHAPKNLAMALSVEVAEIVELFQWIAVDRSRDPDQALREAETILDRLPRLVPVRCLAGRLARQSGRLRNLAFTDSLTGRIDGLTDHIENRNWRDLAKSVKMMVSRVAGNDCKIRSPGSRTAREAGQAACQLRQGRWTLADDRPSPIWSAGNG